MMTQDAAAGIGMPVWRAWTARLALRRAMLQEQFGDLGGKRKMAQKRAAAAEIIAQEANAARLRALLEAAREQAAEKPILSAERRFADARGDWEAAQAAFPEPVEDRAGDAMADVTAGVLANGAPHDALKELPARSPSFPVRWIAARVALIATVAAAGVALYMNLDRIKGDAFIAAGPSALQPDLPEKAGMTASPSGPGVFEKAAITAAADAQPALEEAQPVSEIVVRPSPADDNAGVPRKGKRLPVAAPTPGANPFRTDLAVSDGASRPARGALRGPEVE